MKLVYTAPNLALVSLRRDLLNDAGIASELRNQYAAGGVGELAPIDAWPELWVIDREAERALALVASISEQADGPEWVCGTCRESNPAGFVSCWSCGGER